MRRVRVLGVTWMLATAGVLAGGAPGAGAGTPVTVGTPGTTSVTVNVPATTAPRAPDATQIAVHPGVTVTVSCAGRIRLSRSASAPCAGAAGRFAQPTYTGAGAGALIARVGSGPWVTVGAGPRSLEGTGALALAVNDRMHGCRGSCWNENAGHFTVTIVAPAYPRVPIPVPGPAADRVG